MRTFLILLIFSLLFWISPAIIALLLWIYLVIKLFEIGNTDEDYRD